jgi:Rrf2 family nitric oxide-sensitive transcriptional repressor
MIRVNRRTDYAIRVVLALAKRGPGICTPTSQIQQEMLIPRAIAPGIVADLARSGFVQTFPGRKGGLTLARPADLINLRQIMEQFEEHFTVYDCLISDEECQLTAMCSVRCRWARLRGLIYKELEGITFDELARESLSPTDLFHSATNLV